MHRWLQDLNFRIVLGIILIVVVPAALTLHTVTVPLQPSDVHGNPTPLGYTVSLLIYLVPVLAIQYWFAGRFDEGGGVVRRMRRMIERARGAAPRQVASSPDFRRSAYRRTLLTLVPAGFFLDVVFGYAFLKFENPGATLLKFRFPAVSFSPLGLVHHIPLEEFVFYTLGFMAILSVYIWCDEYWLRLYNVDYEVPPGIPGKGLPAFLAQVQIRTPLTISVLLVALAWLYKKFGPHEFHDGFPSYFAFLVVAALAPSILLFRSTRRFINWQAVSVTVFWVVLTSLIWEATLAAPYKWWGYQEWHMVGLFVQAWFRLPIEAVLLWVIVTFTTVMVYEAYKILISVQRVCHVDWRTALFGQDFSGWLKESFRPARPVSQTERAEGVLAEDAAGVSSDRTRGE